MKKMKTQRKLLSVLVVLSLILANFIQGIPSKVQATETTDLPISAEEITNADITFTGDQLGFSFTLEASGVPLTLEQAQNAPYYLDIDKSSVILYSYNPHMTSLDMSFASIADIAFDNTGKVVYANFDELASDFTYLKNKPVGYEIRLESKTNVNGAEINHFWSMYKGYTEFDLNERNVINGYVATAPTAVILEAGTVSPVGGVENVSIPVDCAEDNTGRITGWTADTANSIKVTVTDAGTAVSQIQINGSTYLSGTDYIVETNYPIIIRVTTTEAGKITSIRTFKVLVVPAENAAVSTIEAYNIANDADTLTIAELNAAGATNTYENNLSAYKTAIENGLIGDFDTYGEIMAVVDRVNIEESRISSIENHNINDDASILTLEDLTLAGIFGIDEKNLGAYRTAVKTGDAGDFDSKLEVQVMIFDVNREVSWNSIIEYYNLKDDATYMTIDDLTLAGVTNTFTENLAAYQAEVAAGEIGDFNTFGEIMAMVDRVNIRCAVK